MAKDKGPAAGPTILALASMEVQRMALLAAQGDEPSASDRSAARVLFVVSQLILELEAATAKHGPMASAHEGYAIILEELDELWDLVKTDAAKGKMYPEALQVAAMGIRFCADVALP